MYLVKRRLCVLQTEDLFRDDDTARGDGPSSMLEGLVIERNLSSEQLSAALPKSGSAADETDAAQLTLNAPALLDRPVPARANPMARLHELGMTLVLAFWWPRIRRCVAFMCDFPAWHAHI